MTRLAFHDWMWDPTHRLPRVRRLCQRLPWYFSDPWAWSFRNLPKEFTRREGCGCPCHDLPETMMLSVACPCHEYREVNER
jgi:hypothetical protein